MNDITQLRIQGMHCAACVVTIEGALSKVDGVQKVVVNLAQETARVEGDVLPQTLINAVTSSGYEATLMDGMSLSANRSRGTSKSDLKQLFPLFLVLFYITMAALLMNRIDFRVANFMYDFMGLFYIVFSFFKFLDYKNFPDSFAMYDPIAKAIPAYGWTYPFLETVLGLAFLLRVELYSALIITLIVLGATTVGVTRALMNKSTIHCACLGTALNLPMTKATFIENSIMLFMAAWMLI